MRFMFGFEFMVFGLVWVVQGIEDVEILGSGASGEFVHPSNASRPFPRLAVSPKSMHCADTPAEACLDVLCEFPLACDAYQPEEGVALFFPLCYDWSRFEHNVQGCPEVPDLCGPGKCINNRCVCPPGTHGNNCETTFTECSYYRCLEGTVCLTFAGGFHRCDLISTHGLPEVVEPAVLRPFTSPVLVPRSTVCTGVNCGSRLICEDFYLTTELTFPLCVAADVADCNAGDCGSGTCLNGKCVCRVGTGGNRCETDSTLCLTFPCPSGGTCLTISGGGRTCQYPITSSVSTTTIRFLADACVDNLCNNAVNAQCGCFPSCMHELGYFCLSSAGYIGRNCNIRPPSISCDSNLIRLTIQTDFFEEYARASASAFMYVSSTLDGPGSYTRECRGNFTNGLYTFALSPFSFACGNSVVSGSGSEVVYANSIWINIKPNSRYDLPHPVIDFSCSYQKEYSLVTSLQPVVDETRSDISGVLRGTPKISLCKVPTCADVCPPHLVVERGAVYTVAELIHLTVSVTTPDMSSLVSNYQMEVKDAYLSCTSYRTDTDNVLLISQCENGKELEARVGRRDDRTACMSFRVPRLNGCTQFYIHVRMFLCAKEHLETMVCRNGRTYKVCLEGVQKRSLQLSDSNLAHQVVGPIMIVPARNGRGKLSFSSNNGRVMEISFNQTETPSTASPHKDFGSYPMTTVIFCVTAVFSLIIFVLLALLVLRRLGAF